LHVGDRAEQQLEGLLGPDEAEEIDETQDAAAVGALTMVAGAAGDQRSNSSATPAKKLFGTGAELRSQVAGEDGRQLVRIPQDDVRSSAAVSAASLTRTAPPRGDKVSVGVAGVLFIIYPPGGGGNSLLTVIFPTI
jgi:hypothetical protein